MVDAEHRPPPVLLMPDKGRLRKKELLQVRVYLQDAQHQGLNWAVVGEHLSKKTGLSCPSCVLGWSLFFIFLKIFIHLTASGLGCHTQDLSFRRTASLVVVHGLRCSVAHGVLVPQPGTEPTSPAVQGGFLTTRPPGKSLDGVS